MHGSGVDHGLVPIHEQVEDEPVVSSMLSVPRVTTPAAPPSRRCFIRPESATTSSIVRSDPGTWRNDAAETDATPDSSGTASTISSPVSFGVTPGPAAPVEDDRTAQGENRYGGKGQLAPIFGGGMSRQAYRGSRPRSKGADPAAPGHPRSGSWTESWYSREARKTKTPRGCASAHKV